MATKKKAAKRKPAKKKAASRKKSTAKRKSASRKKSPAKRKSSRSSGMGLVAVGALGVAAGYLLSSAMGGEKAGS